MLKKLESSEDICSSFDLHWRIFLYYFIKQANIHLPIKNEETSTRRPCMLSHHSLCTSHAVCIRAASSSLCIRDKPWISRCMQVFFSPTLFLTYIQSSSVPRNLHSDPLLRNEWLISTIKKKTFCDTQCCWCCRNADISFTTIVNPGSSARYYAPNGKWTSSTMRYTVHAVCVGPCIWKTLNG